MLRHGEKHDAKTYARSMSYTIAVTTTDPDEYRPVPPAVVRPRAATPRFTKQPSDFAGGENQTRPIHGKQRADVAIGQ